MTLPKGLCNLTAILLLAGCDAPVQSDPGTAPEAGASGVDQTTVARCASCHQGAMSLTGRSSEEVADAIRAIVEGEQPHVPLDLLDSDDETVEGLAEALTQ